MGRGGGSKAVWEFSKKTSSLGNPVTPNEQRLNRNHDHTEAEAKNKAPVRRRVEVFPGGWLIEVSPGVRCRAWQWDGGRSLSIASPSSNSTAIFKLPMFWSGRLTPPFLPIASHLLTLLPIFLSTFTLLLFGFPVADRLFQESWDQVKLSISTNLISLVLVTITRDTKQRVDEYSRTQSAPFQSSN